MIEWHRPIEPNKGKQVLLPLL